MKWRGKSGDIQSLGTGDHLLAGVSPSSSSATSWFLLLTSSFVLWLATGLHFLLCLGGSPLAAQSLLFQYHSLCLLFPLGILHWALHSVTLCTVWLVANVGRRRGSQVHRLLRHQVELVEIESSDPLLVEHPLLQALRLPLLGSSEERLPDGALALRRSHGQEAGEEGTVDLVLYL